MLMIVEYSRHSGNFTVSARPSVVDSWSYFTGPDLSELFESAKEVIGSPEDLPPEIEKALDDKDDAEYNAYIGFEEPEED